MPRFGSVLTAMITPFDSDGGLDLDGAVAVARHLAASGSDGLVVAGTTGEGPVLTDDERIELFRAVIGAVDVPVIASTGTNDTAHSVMLTKEAEASGADGVLVVTPYYNRPSAAGLSAHFRAVAEATDLPVVLYDIPARSGRRIGPALTVELAREVRNIVAVKDSTGDVAAAATVVAESPAAFEVFSGDDSLTLPFLSVGGVGVISVASHWAGGLFAELVDSHRSGDVGRATTVNQQLAESYRFESTDEYPNPVPAKAACRALGLPAGQCRLPNAPAPKALDDQARAVIAKLGRLNPAHQSVA
ncbi:MAG TPA: 4-hydroxy-tetrahydrodipicolinate synthase [Acidimicrobiales bacterium]|nr:4-hydroxy-tetrahydrodipicolinate synthase [Acidimicrobiales bacterium]